MRVRILASGQGLMIRGNAIHDQPQKQSWVDPTGQRQPRGHMTYENRAIDWSGHDVLIADANANNAAGSMDEVAIADNAEIGGILAQASRGIANTSISGNQGEGRLAYSCGVAATGNSGFQEETCLDP